MEFFFNTYAFSLIFFGATAFCQILPSVQFGVKGGANLSKFSTKNTFSSDNQAGYYAGLWARIGAAGVHFQPELYLSGKNTTLVNEADGLENKVKFTSLDVPLLIGTNFRKSCFVSQVDTNLTNIQTSTELPC